MANKYCNLQGTQKISESYHNINTGFDQVENDIEENKTKIHNHINGVSDRHDAEVITYSGIVPGATNVKQAIDNTRNRVEEIITTPSESVSAQEIIDARGGYISLGGRLDELESQMADAVYYVTPEMYGAIGDGYTDDSVAIQQAIDTGKTVIFGTKKYKIENPIFISNDGQTFIGNGRNFQYKIPNLIISGNGSVDILARRVTFQNMVFQGDIDNYPERLLLFGRASSTDANFPDKHSYENTISNCGFYGRVTDYAIIFSGAEVNKIINSHFSVGSTMGVVLYTHNKENKYQSSFFDNNNTEISCVLNTIRDSELKLYPINDSTNADKLKGIVVHDKVEDTMNLYDNIFFDTGNGDVVLDTLPKYFYIEIDKNSTQRICSITNCYCEGDYLNSSFIYAKTTDGTEKIGSIQVVGNIMQRSHNNEYAIIFENIYLENSYFENNIILNHPDIGGNGVRFHKIINSNIAIPEGAVNEGLNYIEELRGSILRSRYEIKSEDIGLVDRSIVISRDKVILANIDNYKVGDVKLTDITSQALKLPVLDYPLLSLNLPDGLLYVLSSGYIMSQINDDSVYFQHITTEQNTPQYPRIGYMRFNTSLGKPQWYDGSAWVDASGN